jgi:hypothetical protein
MVESKTGTSGTASSGATPVRPDDRDHRGRFEKSADRREARNGDLRPHLEEVHDLLCMANRKGVRIPSDIIAVMVETRRAYDDGGQPDADLETRFWNAYGLLRSAIEPTHRARRTYRYVFYATLSVLLLCQFGYLVGASLQDQISRLDSENAVLVGQQQVVAAAQAEGAGAQPSAALAQTPETIERQIAANRDDRAAFGDLAWTLMPWLDSETLAIAWLSIGLAFFGTYVLPALYGLLGSCAFVLRQLSDDIGKLRFASDVRGQYTLRLNIGLLAGLSVGWFVSPGNEAGVVASLSPLALAFVAGYGSDLLFAVLDRIVQAFTTPQGDSSVTREESVAGLRRVQETRIETRVDDGAAERRDDDMDGQDLSKAPDRAPRAA